MCVYLTSAEDSLDPLENVWFVPLLLFKNLISHLRFKLQLEQLLLLVKALCYCSCAASSRPGHAEGCPRAFSETADWFVRWRMGSHS